MQKFEKNTKLLMISDLLYSVTAIFAETFLVAYLLNVTNTNITKVAIYYIVLYSINGLGMNLILKYIKKHISKCNKLLSIGIMIRGLVILFIVLLSDKISAYYILIASIFAFSEILYWGAHEPLYVDVTTGDNRKKYMSYKKMLSKLINIIIPIILGTSIQLYSFSTIAIYIFGLSLIQIIISLGIKPNNIIEDKINGKYDLKKLFSLIKEKKLEKLKKYQQSAIAYGIVESSISTLIIIVTMMTFKTNMNLGILTTVFALCSMISLLLYNKFSIKNYTSKIVYILSIMLLISVFGLVFNINRITLIIYNFIYAITFCLFDVIYNSKKGDLINECGINEFKIEFISMSSIFISIGRVIGYTLMLIMSFINNLVAFKVLLIIVSIFAPIYVLLINKTDK